MSNWGLIFPALLGSGVVAAALTQGVVATCDLLKRRASARVVALDLVLSLEKFGCGCANLAAETNRFHYSAGAIGSMPSEMPALPDIPSDQDFSLLPIGIASTFLEFQASVEQANVSLQDECAADIFELAMPLIVRHGEMGFALARRFRRKMGLPDLMSKDLRHGWRYLVEEGRGLTLHAGPA